MFKASSWKTTSAGITGIASGVCMLIFTAPLTQPAVMGALALILPGIGLLFARDNDKTSEDVGADKK